MMPVRTSLQDDQLQSRLARIPPELFDGITRNLPAPFLRNLRLSCKLIERRLFVSFAEEFNNKQYMLTYFSLQTLVNISRHEDISPYVTEIQIGTDRYVTEHAVYHRERSSQLAFLSGGIHREMLTEAFSKLPNLYKIVIRDYDQPVRKSYGALTANKGTAMQATLPNNGEGNGEVCILNGSLSTYVYYIWFGVLSAMASLNTGESPKHIELLLSQVDSYILDKNMYIPEYLVPKLAPILQRLQVLHLRIGFSADDKGCFSLQEFLCMTPNLQHLSINICYYYQRDTANGTRYLLRWLAHDTTALKSCNLPAPMKFPRLEQLDLGDMRDVQADDLIKLANHFSQTLVGLGLHHIHLHSKESVWPPVLRAIVQMKLRVLDLDNISDKRMGYSGKSMSSLSMREFCDEVINKFSVMVDAPVIHNNEDNDEDNEEFAVW